MVLVVFMLGKFGFSYVKTLDTSNAGWETRYVNMVTDIELADKIPERS